MGECVLADMNWGFGGYAARALVLGGVLYVFVAAPDATLLRVLGWALFKAAGAAVAMLWWRLGLGLGLRPVHRGDVLLVRASTSYGLHIYRDHVLYIGTRNTGGGIIGTVLPVVWRAGRPVATPHLARSTNPARPLPPARHPCQSSRTGA
jgi:hypothetical protein